LSVGTVLTLGYGSFGSVNFLPTLGYGEYGTSPPPTIQPSGGYEIARLGGRRRTPEDIRRAREEFGILPARIIEDVALRQAEDLRRDEQQRIDELRGELRLQGLEMESAHIEALNARRQALIDAEIGMRIRARMEAEEMAILMLLAASV